MYNSIVDSKSQRKNLTHRFTRVHKPLFCRNIRRRLEAQARLNLPYMPSCRTAGCSDECDQNWAAKEYKCCLKHLTALATVPQYSKTKIRTLDDANIDPETDPKIDIYRGYFRLLRNASPAQHKRVKDDFRRLVRRWVKRYSERKGRLYQIEHRATLHATTPTDAHYDYHLWSDVPSHLLCRVVRQSWEKASGRQRGCTCVLMTLNELKGWAKYQVKERESDKATDVPMMASMLGEEVPQYSKTKIRTLDDTKADVVDEEIDIDQVNVDLEVQGKKKPVLMLRSSRELGINRTWTTRGYWAGSSKEAVWKELLDEWFPKECPKCRNQVPRAVGDCPDCGLKTTTEAPVYVIQPDGSKRLATREERGLEIKRPIIPGVCIPLDKARFLKALPTDPSQAVHVSVYAKQWGLDRNNFAQIDCSDLEAYYRSIPKGGDGYMSFVLGQCPGAVQTPDGRWYRDEIRPSSP